MSVFFQQLIQRLMQCIVFLMCSNEALQQLLLNLWGIELDVPPIFTEMEMKSVDVHIPFVGIDRLVLSLLFFM